MKLFDLHCDTIYESCVKKKDFFKNDLNIDLCRGLKRYSPWFQVFAVWMPDEYKGQAAKDHFKKCYDYFLSQVDKYRNLVTFIKDYNDISESGNKCNAFLAVEGGNVLAGDIGQIDYLASCGVKLITLTWNGPNEIADGCLTKHSKGLTDFGKLAIKKMEQKNIIIDVSHLADTGFYDIVEIASRPFVATHSNSRTVCNNSRNLTDDQFKKIKSFHGLVGINFHTKFINNNSVADFDDIEKHIYHFLSLGGENVICLGSDFDGAHMPKCLNGIEYIESLADYLCKKNYNIDVINKLVFNNAFKFFTNYFHQL